MRAPVRLGVLVCLLAGLAPACRKKQPDPLQACAAGGNADLCAAICEKQPGPVCEVSADGDPANAVKYLTKACDAKDDVACERLVVAYARGTNAPVDPAKAKAYADRTCALGETLVSCKQARALVQAR